ncbi:MAG: UTP--glucose-1-phosphate uridylyltransferase [Terriglobia bacterium]|jgi:UTP--glucose-1-phosphate uridylyltransferase
MSPKVISAVFPAAGLGTRFLPATKAQPKEMLSLIDKPLIQYGIDEAVDSGIEKIIIVTGRGKYAIEDHFDESFELEHLLEKKLKGLQNNARENCAKTEKWERAIDETLKRLQGDTKQDAAKISQEVLAEIRKRLNDECKKDADKINDQEDLLGVVRGIIKETADVCYIRQKEALGLGHAVLRARRLIGREPFAVVLADDIIDAKKPCVLQLIEAYESLVCQDPKNPPGAILAVMEVPWEETSRYGIVATEPAADARGDLLKIVDMVEKPKENPPSNLAIIGRYVLAPEIFDSIKATKPGAGGEIQLTDALKHLSQKGAIYAFRFEGTRYDAGDKLGFLKATVALALGRPEFKKEFGTYLLSSAIRDKCRHEAT